MRLLTIAHPIALLKILRQSIVRVSDDSLRKQGMKQGMEIVAINDMNPFIYAEKYVTHYVYASTPQDRQLQIFSQFILSGSTSEPIRIEIEDFDGKRVRYSISREPWIMEEEMLNGKPLEFKVTTCKLLLKILLMISVNNLSVLSI